MPLTKAAKARRTCRRKRGKGNFYWTARAARGAARSMNSRNGTAVEAFHCPHCQMWHIGTPVSSNQPGQPGRTEE